MKKAILIASLFFFTASSFANPVIKAISNGTWKVSSTWDLHRIPQDGDSVIIPGNMTVTLNDLRSLNNIHMVVAGVLRLNNPHSELDINSASTIVIPEGGAIQLTGSSEAINFAGLDILTSGQVTGPKQLSTRTGGLFASFDPLPVRFVGFTATLNDNNILVQWTTSQEANASMFELERSFDGSSWNTIAYVAATGTSANLNQYSFKDKNTGASVVHYRVKEVDVNGSVTYTTIKSLRAAATVATDVKIAAVSKKVLLQFGKEVKGTVVVRFITANGQLAGEQTLNSPAGQVVLNTQSNMSGNYFVSVSNGQDLNIAKQILL